MGCSYQRCGSGSGTVWILISFGYIWILEKAVEVRDAIFSLEVKFEFELWQNPPDLRTYGTFTSKEALLKGP
jgi:hypothetical protein